MDSTSREVFSGDYVRAMDSLPVSRFRWLVPKLGLKPTDSVVDFGCGSGRLVDCIHERIAGYSGVDFSPEFIDYARGRVRELGIRNATFECAEVVDFCARHSEAFDVAVTVDFDGYLDDSTFVRIYSAIRAALRPSGRLFIYIANGQYLLEILKRRGLFPSPKGRYLRLRTGAEHERLCREAGFREVEVGFTAHFNALRRLHALSHLPIFGQYFQAKVLVTCRK